MKFDSLLIVLIFNLILWTFVKTIPIRKGLTKQVERDLIAKDLAKILNDGAGSSINPQIQKHDETLTIKDTDSNNGEDKGFNKKEYNKEYYQKNKKRYCENNRKYREQNKEKIKESKHNYYQRNKTENSQYSKAYYQKNRERILNNKKIYHQNNKEKRNEYNRKYYRKRKNVQLENNEGTSFVNPQTGDFTNKGKLPIVCEESFEVGNRLNQGEEESNNGEKEQNQIEVEEPNKILEEDTIDLNKKIHPFDLKTRNLRMNKKAIDKKIFC